ncbi:MAG: S-layer homology domain-containing protein [Aeromicrobium sp.]|uniref:S-layer homology domain-containing protein n=1 Tax=Aeromicrobium sp. TaxID=1871063 RepID=UPI002614F257|nr:S-layer homology domain-containing protein [Aeromicrobium sp.]MDF1706041.1 S-layer homology domain-containing protein [Aeromicrobium sp.]
MRMLTEMVGHAVALSLAAGLLVVDVVATGPNAATTATVPHEVRLDRTAGPAPGTLTITWSGVDGARTYRTTATPVAGGDPVTAWSTLTSTTLRGLADNVTYDVTVQAWNDAGWSGASLPVRATTLGSGSQYTFHDTPLLHPFAWEIAWLASTGITTGYDDGTFRPTGLARREQIAAFFYRLAGRPEVTLPSTSPFTDVPTTAHFYREIVWLASTGITTGYDDGTFRPTGIAQREQIAAFLYRLAGRPEVTLPSTSPFTDVPTTAHFYREIVWLASTGITTGYDDGTFRPTGIAQREQIAAFLYRRASQPETTRPETPPPIPEGPCGVRIVKPDGTPWTCTFADDFTGTTLDRSKWLPLETAQSGYSIGNDCYLDSPENIAVGSGTLKLTARTVDPMTCQSPIGDYPSEHTAGSVSTWALFSQTYGRFEMRAKMPSVTAPGTHSAFWLYPQHPGTYGAFPYSGEIDIVEYFSSWPDRGIPMLHYGPSENGAARTNHHCMIADPTQFHAYTAEWSRTGITILYDGQVCLTHTWEEVAGTPLGAPFDQPFTLTLTQGVGTVGNLPSSATAFPATMEIDYVRVWS